MPLTLTQKFYTKAFVSAFNKELDCNGGTDIYCSLHTNLYVPSQHTHQYYDVSVNNELSVGTGYATGGAVISSPSVTSSGGVIKFDGGDVTFTGNTQACRYAVVRDRAPASNKPLICYLDLGEDAIITEIRWNANGIAQVTVA